MGHTLIPAVRIETQVLSVLNLKKTTDFVFVRIRPHFQFLVGQVFFQFTKELLTMLNNFLKLDLLTVRDG